MFPGSAIVRSFGTLPNPSLAFPVAPGRRTMGRMNGPDPHELALVDRLAVLAAAGPGRNEAVLAEALAVLARLDTGTGYRGEKIRFAKDAFAVWLSDRKWRNWGEDPGVYRGIILSHVATVRFAVEQLVNS